ncbi:MAG: hypothetical protein LBO67_02635 [Spirochaetaceae bacterium]|jgi:TRAP-type C4-dicarboxylate transport system permease small subunit|nr:hypothetical protein [Spirochaetaceae bacterium]
MYQMFWAKKPLVVQVVKYSIMVLAGLCTIFFMLYWLSSAHEWTEEAQVMLCQVSGILGLILGISSVYGIIVDLWMCLRRRSVRWLWGVLGYTVLLIFGIATTVLTDIILVIAKGNI